MSGGDVNSCGSSCVDAARFEMSNSSLSGLLTFGAGARVSLAARAGGASESDEGSLGECFEAGLVFFSNRCRRRWSSSLVLGRLRGADEFQSNAFRPI